MAQEARISGHGAGHYASGDTVCVPGGHAWSDWRNCPWSRDRDCLLVARRTAASHGRRGATSTAARCVVTGHYFLFPGVVLFFQNADISQRPARLSSQEYLRVANFKYYFKCVAA